MPRVRLGRTLEKTILENNMKITISNKIILEDVPEPVLDELKKELIIKNPKRAENERLGYSNYNTPPYLYFIKRTPKGNYTIPRGYINKLGGILNSCGIMGEEIIHDKCNTPITFKVGLKLRDYQRDATDSVYLYKEAVLQAPTGSGKTAIAIWVMGLRQQSTLIIVHTKELMYQWEERIKQFTDMPHEYIGLYGDGHKEKKSITIAIINSLNKSKAEWKDFFGFVIVDECHRCPSSTFTSFLSRVNPKYLLGLSATPYRRDGLGKVINFYLGETVHKIETKQLQERGHIMKATYKVIPTAFHKQVVSSADYPEVIKELVLCEDRNNLIVDEAIKESRRTTGVVLVISDRKEHCQTLYSRTEIRYRPTILTGSSSQSMRKEVIKQLGEGKFKILYATGQLIGEGFDCPLLATLIITTPIKYEGRLIQYMGRVLRVAEGKDKSTVIDFNDPCWLLQGSLKKRIQTYKENGMVEEKGELDTYV